MRKIAFILSAAALIFTACEKNEDIVSDNYGALLVNATVEQQEDGTGTKTSLSDNSVVWSSGDQINLFTSDGTYTLTLKSGAGSTSGTFKIETKPTGDFKYAIYPASDNNSLTDDIITFNIPASQTYAAGSFGPGANVAVAKYVKGSNLSFTNVCGVLKLQLTGTATVTSIELSGTSNEVICGKYTADMTQDKPAAAYSSDGGTTITLDCSKETDGGVILTSTATPFCFVVPQGAFANGFIAQVHTSDSKTYIVSSTKTTNTISRSKVRAMPETAFQYQKVQYLQSTKKQYISTGIVPINTTGAKAVFQWTSIETSDLYEFSFLGARNDSQRFYVPGSISNGKNYAFGYQNYYNGSFSWKASTTYISYNNYLNDRIVKVNETSLASNIQGTITGITADIYLFGIYDGTVGTGSYLYGSMATGKLYSAIITEGTTFVRNFIPAVCKKDASYTDGNTGNTVTATADKPGMYDLVTGKFFVNQGTDADFTTDLDVTK